MFTSHYIFSYLWVEIRIFNKFKEFDLCWYCHMSSQVLSFTWFFISNKFSCSTGGTHEISRRAACGLRAAGWTALP